eukprot:gene5012-6272_t
MPGPAPDHVLAPAPDMVQKSREHNTNILPWSPPMPRDAHPAPAAKTDLIRIRGARQHNLKDVNLDLPRGKLVVLTGLSGSGKSSLVFAGLIPALREGMLAGSRCGEEGLPAPWKIVVFHPGDDPLDNLTEAIVKAAANPEEPHLAGFIRAALNAGDGGLVEALRI